MEAKFLRDFKAARRAGVPLLAIETADPTSCMKQIRGISKTAPIVTWDKSEGFLAEESALGGLMLTEILGEKADPGTGEQANNWAIVEFDAAMRKASEFPGRGKPVAGQKLGNGSILFVMSGDSFLDNQCPESVVNRQAFWNLRDQYKKNFRMVVLLCSSIQLVGQLKQDVIVLDHPLPTTEELEETVKIIYQEAKLEEPKPPAITSIAQEVKGLSQFTAESVLAMSITPEGMDMSQLWMHKKKTIEQNPGMSVWSEMIDLDMVQGIQNIKDFGRMVMESEDGPTYVLFLDELEKQLAGTVGHDDTMKEMHGQWLAWMANNEVMAMLLTGQPGCGKTHFAKALAGQYHRMLAILNLSEVKSKWVGESTGQFKTILKTCSSIGKPLVIATTNDPEILSPELKDRFNLGTYFVDFPGKKERRASWEQYADKYSTQKHKINPDINFDDELWSPRNIRDCCSLAKVSKWPLEKVAKSIITIRQSNYQSIVQRRKNAAGRYLSAEYPGVYQVEKIQDSATVRAIDLTSGVGEA